MRERFPSFDGAELTWMNVAEAGGPRLVEIEALLLEHISEAEAIVEVSRKLGAVLAHGEAASFVGSHISEGQIRATNRECTGYVVVSTNGAAYGWHTC
jgi:hypothetical protein